MIKKYKHHDIEVSVQEHLLGKHREHCLCYQDCIYFKPEDVNTNCEVARAVLKMDKQFGLVTPVWECPKFTNKSTTTEQVKEFYKTKYKFLTTKEIIMLNKTNKNSNWLEWMEALKAYALLGIVGENGSVIVEQIEENTCKELYNQGLDVSKAFNQLFFEEVAKRL